MPDERPRLGPVTGGPAPGISSSVRTSARWARAMLTRPEVWAVAILIGAGAWRVGGILHEAFARYPLATTTAVAAFALYAVPFVLLLRVIDFMEPEPVPLRVTAFAWGGLVATSAAIAGSAALQDILAKVGSPALAAEWGPALAGATVEELLKALGVVTIALLARSHINSTVDGFVYGALVGLGFQVVENVVFAVNAVALDSARDSVGPVIVTVLLRGFLGGLWSHALFTGLAGAGIAYALVRSDRSVRVRWAVAAALFAGAWGFHFLWNSPLLADGFGFGVAGVAAVVLLKGTPALLVAIVLVVAAERREAGIYAATLSGFGEPQACTEDEIVELISPRRRHAARRQARDRLGWTGARAVRRLQRAQARLAVALTRAGNPRFHGEVPARYRDVLDRRADLRELSHSAGGRSPRRTSLAAAAIVVLEAALVGVLVIGVGFAIRALGGA